MILATWPLVGFQTQPPPPQFSGLSVRFPRCSFLSLPPPREIAIALTHNAPFGDVLSWQFVPVHGVIGGRVQHAEPDSPIVGPA